jgi:hypothetical protein
MRLSMHTNILKWVTIAVLLLVGLRLPAVVLFNPDLSMGLAGKIFLCLDGRSMPCGLPGLLRCVEEATIAVDASVTNRSRGTGPCKAASRVE